MATTRVNASELPSPYHHGEVAVQIRAGVRDISNSIGKFIRDYLDEQHKAFFEGLNHLHVGFRNDDGNVWATTLCGQPGFIKAIERSRLSIELKQAYGDPVRLCEGLPFGSVGVMLHNRRRNKLNGRIESLSPNSLTLSVSQAIGNCPKYIQLRTVTIDKGSLAAMGSEKRWIQRGETTLREEQKAFIGRSDTVFLATAYLGGEEGAGKLDSCDCNHRGGSPGFVKIIEDSKLMIPDYIGNNMFQSLGNIVTNPAVGLQFLDFASGDSLQLTGNVEVLHDDHTLPGAQRALRFSIKQWVHVKKALPFVLEGPTELSPYNPVLEESSSAAMTVKCTLRRPETDDITTYGFAATQSQEKAFCEPGQFASFDFTFNKPDVLNRTWTISSTPLEVARTGTFTISVKKIGLVSTWLEENMAVGGEIKFRGVDGDFTLDKAATCIPPAGVLLIAGGIGITPIRVIFAECLRRGYRVVLLYTFRTAKDAAFLKEFQDGAHEHKNVRLAVALTGRNAESLPDVETFHGRFSANMIKQVCPDCAERETFQCGPIPMMNSVTSALESLGVSTTKIHQEAFNF